MSKSKSTRVTTNEGVAERIAKQDIATESAEVAIMDAGITEIMGTDLQDIAIVSPTIPIDASVTIPAIAKTARRSWFPWGDLNSEIATKNGMKASDLNKAFHDLFKRTTELLAVGEVVVYPTLGSFTGRVVHARPVRVPSTGEIVQTKDRVRVKFKASTKVNDLLDTCTVSAFEKQAK